MTYNTTSATNVSVSYDNRLRPLTYQAQSFTNEVQDKTYTYNADGTVKEALNNNEADFSQYNQYDFAGRIKRNDFGTTTTGQPYTQSLNYDVFNNITSRNTEAWNSERNFTASYTNNRKTGGLHNYGGGNIQTSDSFDTAGNTTMNIVYEAMTNRRNWKYDAAGRMADWEEVLPYYNGLRFEGAELFFDGDGRTVKRINRVKNTSGGNPNAQWGYTPEYSIYSSITGQQITTLSQTGSREKTFVYFGAMVIAEQRWLSSPNSYINYKFTDPITGSEEETQASGEVTPHGVGRVDRGALGTVVPSSEPEEFPMPDYRKGGGVGQPETQCQVNSHPMSCNQMKDLLSAWGVLGAGGQVFDVSVWRYNIWKFPKGTNTNGSLEWIQQEVPGKLVGTLYVAYYSLVSLPNDKFRSLFDAPYSAYPNPSKSLQPKVEEAIKDETCQKKLNALLQKLDSKIKSISDLISNIFQGNGIKLYLTDNPVEFVYKKGFWYKAKEKQIKAPAGEYDDNKIIINRQYYGDSYEVVTLIHEAIHTTEDSHQNIASAIADLEGFGKQFREYINGVNKDQREDESSNFINHWINRYCTERRSGEWDSTLKRLGFN